MATDEGVPTAHALLNLLVTTADLTTGVTILTDVIVLEHPHEQAPLPVFGARVSFWGS